MYARENGFETVCRGIEKKFCVHPRGFVGHPLDDYVGEPAVAGTGNGQGPVVETARQCQASVTVVEGRPRMQFEDRNAGRCPDEVRQGGAVKSHDCSGATEQSDLVGKPAGPGARLLHPACRPAGA